jgi:hypothetical protein
VWFIIPPPGLALYRRSRLNSNVRPRNLQLPEMPSRFVGIAIPSFASAAAAEVRCAGEAAERTSTSSSARRAFVAQLRGKAVESAVSGWLALRAGVLRRAVRFTVAPPARPLIRLACAVQAALLAPVALWSSTWRPARLDSFVSRPGGLPPARPNPSFNRTRYGMPPWPGRRYAVHCRQPGQGVLP